MPAHFEEKFLWKDEILWKDRKNSLELRDAVTNPIFQLNFQLLLYVGQNCATICAKILNIDLHLQFYLDYYTEFF